MKFLFCLLVLAGLFANAQPSPIQTKEAKLYDVASLQQDFDTLYHWLQASNPALHFAITKTEADRKWAEARKKLSKPMTRVEFMKLVVPLTTQYKDGHTAIFLDPWAPELKEYEQSGGTLFPAQLLLRDGRAWVKHNFQTNSQLAVGDEILAINGKPMKDIITTLLPYWPGDGIRINEQVLSRFFSISLWYIYGWGNDVALKVRSGSNIKTMQLKGLPDSVLTRSRNALKNTWKLHVYEKESLAVIECNTYDNMKKAMAFADSAFTVIKEKGIRNVALDLRQNEGGNSSIGDLILNYVTKKPFAPFVTKSLLRENVLAQQEDNKWVRNMIDNASTNWKTNGNYYTIEIQPFRPDSLEKPELFFNGKFFLLTSGVTFSSAHMTAIEVKCFNLGTIIGEPTGERLSLSGEMMSIELPVTKLFGSCAAAAYTTPCGDPKQVGVQPDIVVPFNAKDLATGKDTGIEFLKTRLLK